MKISTKRLKKIIRESLHMREVCVHEIRYMGDELLESIKGHVHGDPAKDKFVDIAMAAMRKSDYRRATNAILDSYMMDDTHPEEEQALTDMLASTPAGVSVSEIEAIADRWYQMFKAGELLPEHFRITKKQLKRLIREAVREEWMSQGPSKEQKMYDEIVKTLEFSAEMGGGSADAAFLVMAVNQVHKDLKAEDIHSFLDRMVEDGELRLDPRTQELSLTR